MGEAEQPPETRGGPWADRLGRWAIRSLQVLLVLALVAVVVRVLVEVRLVMIPLFVALILGSAAWPAIDWLRRRGLPPLLAAWATLLGALALVGGIVALVVVAIRAQWDELVRAGADAYGRVEALMTDLPPPISDIDWEGVSERVTELATSPRIGVGAIAGVTTAVHVLTGIALVVVLLFFFLKDGDAIWRFFLSPLDDPPRARAERIGETSVTVLGGYLRGTALIALVESVAMGVTLALLGVPLALPLAAIVFLGAFVPLVGGFVAGAFAALVAFATEGGVPALVVIAVAVAVNQLEGDLLQPMIMSQTVSLHPLAVLVAIAAGTVVSGVVGALLAVPLTAVGWAIVKVWNGPVDTPPPRRGRLARLFGRSGRASD